MGDCEASLPRCSIASPPVLLLSSCLTSMNGVHSQSVSSNRNYQIIDIRTYVFIRGVRLANLRLFASRLAQADSPLTWRDHLFLHPWGEAVRFSFLFFHNNTFEKDCPSSRYQHAACREKDD